MPVTRKGKFYMYNLKTLMISAIIVCILILGGFHYSDRRSQSAYAVWAQEQNRILNGSQRAAEAEVSKKAASDSKSAQETEASETSPAAEESDAEETQPVQIWKYTTTAGVNVRDSASPDGERIGVLEKGTVLEEAQAEGDWIHFRYNGKDGYVSANYVSAEE